MIETITLIKCIMGVFWMLGGVGLQVRSKGNDPYDFITGTEFVLAGLIIIATA